MDYTLHCEIDRNKMLDSIQVSSIEDLIDRVLPSKYQLPKPLNLPPGASEMELTTEYKELAALNKPASESICFLGGGAYDHYIPAAIGQILTRSEFATAYTPYQAEVSQGTLQTIYEFQTMICRLTGMDAANASHYDGASALAEAVILTTRKTKRNAIAVPASLNPAFRDVLDTYCCPLDIEIREVPCPEGIIDLNSLEDLVTGSSAVIVQHPNYSGLLEPARRVAETAHKAGALVIASCNPMSLALFEPPGEWGADIYTGEGQPFGAPLNLGGPYVGLFAVKKPLLRMMPGRLVAAAIDTKDRDGFVLTLQTREQHIRREKATSNICTNEALVALGSLIYLSLVGRDGLRRAALNSYRGAHYLRSALNDIPGVQLKYSTEFFNEIVIETRLPAEKLQTGLIELGLFIGPCFQNVDGKENHSILLAVTEKRTKAQIDHLVSSLKELLHCKI